MPPAKRTAASTEALRSSLVAHARRLVEREGAHALTMRALAAEAGCALGLPYKVFANREELVMALLHDEFLRLHDHFEKWVTGAGKKTVGKNLVDYARLLLGSPAVGLAREIEHDPVLSRTLDESAVTTGFVASLGTTVSSYLALEKALGRVDQRADENAFGLLITGAIHNLLVSGQAYPGAARQQLEQALEAVARTLAPTKTLGTRKAKKASDDD